MSERFITCPRCESPLIQIESVRRSERGALLDRHCPECDHADMLSVTTALADVLLQHAHELALSLEGLAECLAAAGELWLSDVP